ncbi:hypothetical protein CRN67_08930 [Campylobacter blaseri]|uniref:Uncharacterized protein n=2 Tax=Campylobacter blaseri TaxID=2042961 RepID=A0A2P8QYL5_9BACT|nr:hypothetical protein CQ405_08925 [Campylobacter blaseri]PSM52490.1 hypothetical protein CRN67_08930 [Campylobacter blaseri]
MKKAKFTINKDLYFILIFAVNLAVLLFGISNLSISYYEAEIFFNEKNFVSLIANVSCKIFGQNDYSLRLPFLLIHFINSILMYKLSKKILKRRVDRIACLTLYMFLPGIIASAILVNFAGILIFFTLLFIYLYEIKKDIFALFVLITTVFIDKSFLVLYLGVFFYSIYYKNRPFCILSFLLFIISIIFYDFDIGGKPKGFFADTIGIYAAVFSPFLFLFFVYAIYRIWVKEEKTLLWFIVVTAFCSSLLLSLRQRVELDEFLPYVVISIPLLVKTFYNSYRIRLPNFRRKHKYVAIFTIIVLIFSSSILVFNQILYLNIFKNEPKKHFIYKYDIVKELALNLKNIGIQELNILDEELALRLEFYGVKPNLNNDMVLTEFYIEKPKYNILIYKFSNNIDKFYIF